MLEFSGHFSERIRFGDAIYKKGNAARQFALNSGGSTCSPICRKASQAARRMM